MNMRQAIILANDGLTYLDIYASIDLNVLSCKNEGQQTVTT